MSELPYRVAPSVTRRAMMCRLGAGLVTLMLAGFQALPAAADEPLALRSIRIPVALAPGGPKDQIVSASLCRPFGHGGTLQILLHGGTYSHVYWDFPYAPERYSYVRAMGHAGCATLNLDRLGIGASSHPPADALTGTSEAYVVHQIVQLALKGDLDGSPFDHVVLVGHSLGAFIATSEAGQYHDISGLVLSGNLHNDLDPATLDAFLNALVPARQVLARFAGLPDDYLTTAPGTRDLFYFVPGADPAVIAWDAATRQTMTWSELDGDDLSGAVNVPVFASVGRFDSFNGSVVSRGLPGSPPTPPEGLAAEAAYFPSAPSFYTYLQPRAGHDQNLHLTAPDFFTEVRSWLGSQGLGPRAK